MRNIFDLENLYDLPEEIELQLRGGYEKEKSIKKQILYLFKIKKELTCDEIVVGLYRQFKVIRERGSIHVSLYYLTKNGTLSSYCNDERGRYWRIENV